MNIPENAIKIINRLNKASYEAYFVGGCVRDMVMDKAPKDWDITTSAAPEEVKALFSKTVDTGIKHGTITVIIDRQSYEVTTYRIDGDYKDFRRPEEVSFTSSLKEDLKRRDFTMNAIAFHPNEGYIDYFGGMEDIKHKLIKGVGNASQRFNEDALRMLRAIRFACQLGFDIEEDTFLALKENSGLISHISMERIRDEILKTFCSDYVEKCIYFLECNILYEALSFMRDYLKANLNSYFTGLGKLENSKRNCVSVLSLLLRNINELQIRQVLKEMKLDNTSIKSIASIAPRLSIPIEPEPVYIRNALSQLGVNDFFTLLDIKKALGENTKALYDIAAAVVNNNEPLYLRDLDINGNVIMKELGLKGKATGDMLMFLHKEVLKDPSANKQALLLEMARKRL